MNVYKKMLYDEPHVARHTSPERNKLNYDINNIQYLAYNVHTFDKGLNCIHRLNFKHKQFASHICIQL